MVRGGGEADQMVVSEDHVVGDDVEMRSESVALLDQQLFNHIPLVKNFMNFTRKSHESRFSRLFRAKYSLSF
jgi:hypothetical protein